ncbi:hypothetical protein B0H11DRAFT_324259 [Mycena galericulata]|nr:hypothetical protein B0H11DRAFT_324259 [Mycena galericulata]
MSSVWDHSRLRRQTRHWNLDRPRISGRQAKLTTLTPHRTPNIPLGQSLSSVIDPVLAIMTQIEQTSANTQGFVELAARIELLKPILSQMGTWPSQGQLDVANPASDSAAVVDKRSRGQFVLQALRQEFESMTKDLNAAKSQGTLQRFFDSADNAAYLAKHNTNLTQIISIATLMKFRRLLKILR